MTDATGKALKQFDKPLAVSIDLPKSSLDANGAPVVVGGIYPVWSYDDASGVWKFEKEGVIQEKSPVDPENYTVAFSTNHLSTWNLGIYGPSCTGRIQLNRGTDTRPLKVEIIGLPGGRYTAERLGVRDSIQTILRAPLNSRVTVKVYDGSLLVGNIRSGNLCGLSGIAVPIFLPAPQQGNVTQQGNVIVYVSESCPDGSNKRALPSATVISTSRSSDWEGISTVGVPRRDYSIATYTNKAIGNALVGASNKYTGRWVTESVSILSDRTVTAEFNFPDMECAAVTGAGGSGG